MHLTLATNQSRLFAVLKPRKSRLVNKTICERHYYNHLYVVRCCVQFLRIHSFARSPVCSRAFARQYDRQFSWLFFYFIRNIAHINTQTKLVLNHLTLFIDLYRSLSHNFLTAFLFSHSSHSRAAVSFIWFWIATGKSFAHDRLLFARHFEILSMIDYCNNFCIAQIDLEIESAINVYDFDSRSLITI